ncbi:hypothetical protein [Vibrio cholerae]|uniref:hypothetical protein n=1 Tax=Vibrio cholerae TaxID=666 RepID=UPI0006E5BAE8|nr:hypothetical protein [Vibrio cholerae]EJL6615459.1 hypothetical protein [Vibrio cholerae]KQA34798.1 hypothetical protein XV74_17730 [Vibrio cholerae]KQA40704.1 hypothetical protein XV75_17910 [Vibrio cholerae]KQA52838.1 hypothetical protein XV79_17740 [Vibrio cholerae]KQA73182.1 hypothetical protein XV84_13445 [Vibrio cholerae]
MKVVTLVSPTKQRTFSFDDYEFELNDNGGLASLTFYRAATGAESNTEKVTVNCENKAVGAISSIIHRNYFNFQSVQKLQDDSYPSIMIQGKTFTVGQASSLLKSFVEGATMPLQKSKTKQVLSELNKSRNAAKQEVVTKSSSTQTRQKKLEAFVNKHAPKQADTVAQEVFQSIQKQKLQQKLDTAEVSKSGNMVIEGKEVLLTKAADIQLLSVLSEIKKNFKLENLNLNQQGALAEFITSLAGVSCAVTLTKMANDFIAKLSTIK